jgi:hypothetical protein
MLTNATQPDLDPVMMRESRQAGVYAVAVIFWVLAAFFVALRSYTRAHMLRIFGPEDWCLIVALVCESDLNHVNSNRVQKKKIDTNLASSN